MAKYTCDLQPLTISTDCNLRGGIQKLWLAQYSDVDWSAVTPGTNGEIDDIDPTTFFVTGDTSSLSVWEFEREGAFFDQTYTEDTDRYEQIITIIKNGRNAESVAALRSAVLCCNLIAFVQYNSGGGRLVGAEFDGDTWSLPISALKVGRHLDSSGTLGESKMRDEIDLTGSSFYPAVYLDDVAISKLP